MNYINIEIKIKILQAINVCVKETAASYGGSNVAAMTTINRNIKTQLYSGASHSQYGHLHITDKKHLPVIKRFHCSVGCTSVYNNIHVLD